MVFLALNRSFILVRINIHNPPTDNYHLRGNYLSGNYRRSNREEVNRDVATNGVPFVKKEKKRKEKKSVSRTMHKNSLHGRRSTVLPFVKRTCSGREVSDGVREEGEGRGGSYRAFGARETTRHVTEASRRRHSMHSSVQRSVYTATENSISLR